jgi:xylulokinase
MTLNHSGGMSLRWFRDTLCRDKLEQARGEGKDPYDLILQGSKPGPTDLLVLPHFSGAGTPLLDTTSRAAILGMSFATTQADIAKAILEGLTFEYRTNIDLLKSAGVPVDQLHAAGGGARSKLWLKLKADIGRVPLRVPGVTEAACLGAAMLASVGAKIFTDLASAVRAGVTFSETVLPDPDAVAKYQARYNIFKDLYDRLIPFHRHISGSTG